MNSRIRKDVIVFFALIILGVSTRMIPYVTSLQTWNLNAVTAIALFAGFYFRNPIIALCVPVLTMLFGDMLIVPYHYGEMTVGYVALLAPVLVGPLLRKRFSVVSVGLSALGASVVFFIISNAAYWWFNMPHTSAGFVQAYLNAMPFFRGTLVGNLAFTGLLFGTYAIAAQRGWLGEQVAAPEAATV